MPRLALAAVLAVAGLGVLAGPSAAATPGPSKCVPNVRMGFFVKNGAAVYVYCGSARLTITSAGKTTRYSGGSCYRPGRGLEVGVGRFTQGARVPLYNAVWFVIPGTKNGIYRRAVIAIQRKGQKVQGASGVKAVVRGPRGTFSGKFPKGASFTGSFSCV
jgi:hypothetical protein